jgi:hypothetical protein
VLDDVGRSRLGIARIEARRPPRGPLVKEVIGPVELDLDRLEPGVLLGRQTMTVAGMLPEVLFLVGQGIDSSEDIVIGHERLLPGVDRRESYDRRRIHACQTTAGIEGARPGSGGLVEMRPGFVSRIRSALRSIFAFSLLVRLPCFSCCEARALALAACDLSGIGYLCSSGRPNVESFS